jgi:hypothetical protein
MALRKSALLSADRSQVIGALGAFRGLAGSLWLPTGHPVHTGQFQRRDWPRVWAIAPARLIEAVAASAPNHCIDGWSYAARATSALLAGDYHACRHLAYYAQLRAALSILANLGVGIFNRINFAIDRAGAIQRIDDPAPGRNQLGLGTHEIVWNALKEWSADPVAARTFLDLVKTRGVSLRDSLEAIWPGAGSHAVASTLIGSWGLDLQRGGQDHRERNVSSYTPQMLNPLTSTAGDSLKLVGQFWELCEPTIGTSFDNLDRFLLRGVLQAQHRQVLRHARYSEGSINRNYARLDPRLNTLIPLNFLTSAVEPDDPFLLQCAKATTRPAEPTEMLARSYLLLRAATAFTHTSLLEAGFDLAGGDLRPWIDTYAEQRGFWKPADPLIDPTDLWADIELAMMDFHSSQNPPPASWHDWMSISNNGLPQISEMERVGVWTLSA